MKKLQYDQRLEKKRLETIQQQVKKNLGRVFQFFI